jgi:integrase
MKKKHDEEKRRRQRGTGSIFRKPPNKNWFIQFYKHGKRVREGTGSPDFDNAKKLLRQRLHEIDKNEYVKRTGRPARVSDLYESLKVQREVNNKEGRKRDLPGRWAHLQPELGATLAAEVSTDDILRYTRKRQEQGAANATINRELATLKRMFRIAAQSTPPKVSRVPHIPMLREDNARSGFVEDADYERLAANATELWLRTFLELGYSYGWRRSELLGLHVRQVNLAARAIRLDPGTTKNREGRQVEMTAKVYELLREAVRGKRADDYVLTREAGARVRDFRNAWQNLCVRAGLAQLVCRKCACPAEPSPPKAKRLRGQHGSVYRCPQCRASKHRAFRYEGLIPHDMRRSAAKALRAAGVPESVVMAMGGWKTAAMFRRYAIVSSADQRAAVEMLERARAQRATGTAPETAPLPVLDPSGPKETKPN